MAARTWRGRRAHLRAERSTDHRKVARPISGEFRLLSALDELLQFNLVTFGQIVLIDLTLSGDNAIIIGLAAAGLPPHQRRRAIALGIVGATLLRVLFAWLTYELLEIVGLTLAGGILLLWVTHKMWRETRASAQIDAAECAAQPKTLRGAIISILVADVSMSLDNVLAVAGAAHGYPGMLMFGLALSIALMALAANLVAALLERHRWLAYLGVAVVAFVAFDMIWRGMGEVWSAAAGVG
jgi:YjbE family integral membrane protein